MRLQDLHRVRLKKRMNRIVGILQVGQLPRARGACFTARSGQTLRDPVIAKRAFVGRAFFGMEEAASVRTRLNAIAATQAIFLINEHNSIGSMKSGADGTHLRTGRIDAVVAHLGHEEVFSALCLALGETVYSSLW